MNEPHPVRWKSMIGLGLLSVLVSLFMLFYTGLAVQVIVVLTGVVIILLSAIFLVEGICIDAEGWPRWMILGIGILGLVLGIVAVTIPSVIILSTGLLLGIFLLIYGIGETVIGVGVAFAESMVRMVFIMLGLFSIVLGFFLILKPTLGIDIFVWLIGLYLLVLGLMRIAHGLNEREAERNVVVKRL